MYYWATHPIFGVMTPLRELVTDVLARPVPVMLATWGTIAFEVVLASALLMPAQWRRRFLAGGLAFHFMIVIVHGLAAFFLAMAGALVLFLRLPNEPLRLGLPRVRWSGAGLRLPVPGDRLAPAPGPLFQRVRTG